jgi:hypothetical protein
MDLDSQAFTLFHVVVSLLGIPSGLLVLYGFLTSNRMRGATLVFLVTTVVTSVTGFFFHRTHILPSHIVGVISLVLLTAAIVGLYFFHLKGAWRAIYVVCAVTSLYLNMFVLVAQLFLKVPALHVLAPKRSEPPFAISQAILLVAFLVLGSLTVRRFHPTVTRQ